MLIASKGIYARQLILTTFIIGIPVGVYLFVRFDNVSSGFFLTYPLALLFSLILIFRNFVLVIRRGISWLEVILPILLLLGALAYTSTGQLAILAKTHQFRSLEKRLNAFVDSVKVEQTDELEWVPMPRDLADAGLRYASGKRYEEGNVIVVVGTGGAGGFAYTSERSAQALADLDDFRSYRWRVADNWEAFSR